MEVFTCCLKRIPNLIVKWTLWCVWNQCPVFLLMLQYFVSVEYLTVGFRFTFFNGKVGPFASTEGFLNISRECYWAVSSNHIASHSKALSYKSSGALVLKRITFELESRQQSTAPLPLFCVKRHTTTTGSWKNSATCWLGRPLCLAAFITSIYTYLLLHIIYVLLERRHKKKEI